MIIIQYPLARYCNALYRNKTRSLVDTVVKIAVCTTEPAGPQTTKARHVAYKIKVSVLYFGDD